MLSQACEVTMKWFLFHTWTTGVKKWQCWGRERVSGYLITSHWDLIFLGNLFNNAASKILCVTCRVLGGREWGKNLHLEDYWRENPRSVCFSYWLHMPGHSGKEPSSFQIPSTCVLCLWRREQCAWGGKAVFPAGGNSRHHIITLGKSDTLRQPHSALQALCFQ